MKGKRFAGARPALRITLVLLLALIVAAASCAGCLFYLVSIERADGSWATGAWPKQFTEGFSSHIRAVDGAPVISQDGINDLNRYGLKFVLLDSDGREVLTLGSDDAQGTVLSDTWAVEGAEWTYLIAFPEKIASVTMYLNGERFQSGKATAAVGAIGVLMLLISVGLGYGLWSRAKERLRTETERLREEWIANITHDLKAPLSPICGYAELLADPSNALSADEVRRYGDQTLQSAQRALRLIDDLKLTYQIEGGSIPARFERTDIVRLVKELVIEILNDPHYASRDIAFTGDGALFAEVDVALLRRAVSNVVLNAITHNPPHTVIEVSVARANGGIEIAVRDNGVGLTSGEQERLFERYQRGTGVKIEGSGLGMSIVKQIIELHGGSVRVHSASGKGTSVSLHLPAGTN